MSEAQDNPSLRVKGRLMSASEVERTLVRLAHEIVEKSTEVKTWCWSHQAPRRSAGGAAGKLISPLKNAPSKPACSTFSSIATISPPRACVR